MKRTILPLLLLLSFAIVSAIPQPNQQSLSISPDAPINTNCNLYEIANTHCSSNIRTYQQCMPSIENGSTFGIWKQVNENCAEQGKSCLSGQCLSQSQISTDVVLVLFVIIILIGGLIIWNNRK